jgi:hypothetical protein
LATGGSPRGIASGDFDGDGHIDVAFANNYSKTVTVHFGNGEGGSARTAHLRYRPRPIRRHCGRHQRRRRADLVVANGSNNNVSVLLGTGGGNFGPQRFFATAGDPAQSLLPTSPAMGASTS